MNKLLIAGGGAERALSRNKAFQSVIAQTGHAGYATLPFGASRHRSPTLPALRPARWQADLPFSICRMPDVSTVQIIPACDHTDPRHRGCIWLS